MKEIILQKQTEVTEVAAKIKNSTSVVVFKYQGLTVQKFMQLRRNLRQSGCEVKVVKNNISSRAAKECGYDTLSDAFLGPVALAFSPKDAIAPAKEIFNFARENKQVEAVKGIVDGNVYDFAQLQELSQLPPYEVLLTQLAAGMLGTLRQLAVGLNMLVEKEA